MSSSPRPSAQRIGRTVRRCPSRQRKRQNRNLQRDLVANPSAISHLLTIAFEWSMVTTQMWITTTRRCARISANMGMVISSGRTTTTTPISFTPRILAILAAVARYGLLTSDQIARLDGGSRQNVTRFLQELV